LRRQGLARTIVDELERQAARQGYSRLYLTTGFRQPEAVALYLSAGYTALFDTSVDPEIYGSLPFEKDIGNLLISALAPAPADHRPSLSPQDPARRSSPPAPGNFASN